MEYRFSRHGSVHFLILRAFCGILRPFCAILRSFCAKFLCQKRCQTMRIMVANYHSQRHRNIFLNAAKSFATQCRFPRIWGLGNSMSAYVTPRLQHVPVMPRVSPWEHFKNLLLCQMRRNAWIGPHIGLREHVALCVCNLLVVVHSKCP